ncbi:hypothetical protein L207DRAFT_50335 [Hyaloscypha variabilis F]|uniref:Uncharacterized protein n=1 Tax=Hyaloscypha variabilis (strain UAMH 11265 / GT02V1 / F) TaxID=1149755 RepID=A0A2J6RKH4_HYAVF|nr:hypothetical protein L207DRAFT_50335 [Hyaloscypha variabilis F]
MLKPIFHRAAAVRVQLYNGVRCTHDSLGLIQVVRRVARLTIQEIRIGVFVVFREVDVHACTWAMTMFSLHLVQVTRFYPRDTGISGIIYLRVDYSTLVAEKLAKVLNLRKLGIPWKRLRRTLSKLQNKQSLGSRNDHYPPGPHQPPPHQCLSLWYLLYHPRHSVRFS